ncbi:MAG: hypothetical protein IT364_12475 [Candidatus Hydrogenedentes bacterium]|nr:hypothetical protein [Candidatus Hydrogenedentota bacterium]
MSPTASRILLMIPIIALAIGCSQTASIDGKAKFEQVGYFKSETMRGLTFYLESPNKQDIEAFCKRQKEQLGQGRSLKIHFYDDRAATPDVTLKYEFPDSSQSALIAEYFSNPANSQDGLEFHKSIPEAL